ncbi:TapB family protein [Leeuwenhoekiella aequorea]|uniref:DUF3108 domain-containing protein n=1 Tax=Leeuwenhoekiella aequorea TaxID=283736 RepID=A0A4Q0P500_9FLAO|nr:hypothetical protein [Leeuwenhoekiella aequorea]RXG21683.1 hypothetical protein DSM00_2532 [Leeuwenhoekiella aequorea]
MKTIYHLFSCIFFFSSYCNSQELCSDLFLFDTNTQFEMRAYGATDNLVAITHYDVENIIETEDEKKVILSSFNTDSKNLEGPIGNAEYEIACKQNSLVFHHRNIIPAFLYDEYSNLELDISQVLLKMPVKIKVGDTLSDLQFTIKVIATPITQKLHYTLSDRCVTGKETIKTPAGMFDCIIIESKTSLKPENLNAGYVKQYYSEGIGIVKQIDYNLKGHVSGVNILSQLDL